MNMDFVCVVMAFICAHLLCLPYPGVISIKLSEKKVLQKFAGFFRTPSEQRLYEEKLQILRAMQEDDKFHTSAGATFSAKQYGCGPTCFPETVDAAYIVNETLDKYVDSLDRHGDLSKSVEYSKSRYLSKGGNSPFLQGCCITETSSAHPTWALNSDWVNRTVVQRPDLNLEQYFPSETCERAPDCTSCACTCFQESSLVTAVVATKEKPDDYFMELIQISGPCRCMNKGS